MTRKLLHKYRTFTCVQHYVYADFFTFYIFHLNTINHHCFKVISGWSTDKQIHPFSLETPNTDEGGTYTGELAGDICWRQLPMWAITSFTSSFEPIRRLHGPRSYSNTNCRGRHQQKEGLSPSLRLKLSWLNWPALKDLQNQHLCVSLYLHVVLSVISLIGDFSCETSVLFLMWWPGSVWFHPIREKTEFSQLRSPICEMTEKTTLGGAQL